MSNVVKLKDVIKIIGGGTPSKSEKSFYENGTIKWATVGDMNTDLIVDTELKITEKAVKESSTNILTTDAIVIATRVGLGKVCYLESETAINQDLKGLLPNNDRLTKEYLYYFFKSITKYIIENGTGATVKGVKLDFINDIDIPLPPLPEQQRIVSKLNLLFEKIDKSIALHQKNMDEANAFMGSVLNDVFRELEDKYGLDILSDITDNPKKDIVDGPFGSNLKATEYIDSGIPIIRLQNIQRFKFIDKDIKFVSERKAEQLKRHTFNAGDIVITKLGDPLGKSCIVPKFLNHGIIVADVIRVRANQEKCLIKYIVYTINSQSSIEQFSNSSKGATRQRVKLTMVRDLKISLPPLSIQQHVVKYLDEISEKMEKIKSVQKEKMDSLKALKASILDSAFRGEL